MKAHKLELSTLRDISVAPLVNSGSRDGWVEQVSDLGVGGEAEQFLDLPRSDAHAREYNTLYRARQACYTRRPISSTAMGKLGELVAAHIERCGITQAEFARRTGMTRANVPPLISGDTDPANVKAATLHAIAAELGLTMEQAMGLARPKSVGEVQLSNDIAALQMAVRSVISALRGNMPKLGEDVGAALEAEIARKSKAQGKPFDLSSGLMLELLSTLDRVPSIEEAAALPAEPHHSLKRSRR